VSGRGASDGHTASVGALAERLAELGYERLFLSLDSSLASEIWDQPGAPEALRALVMDPKADLPARFVATALLADRDPGFPSPDIAPAAAEVLVAALRQRLLREANAWYTPPIGPGDLGRVLIGLGEPAREPLREALDDTAELAYGGSREATLAAQWRYRVKDAAAALLAALDSRPPPAGRTRRGRDAEIEALRG
jgi:hypothetical protein